MIRFKIRCRHVGGTTEWTEEYTKDVADPAAWAHDTIAMFNATLRAGEQARELLAVEVIDGSAQDEHAWGKTNLVTLERHGIGYDTLRCDRCGITAKRLGIQYIVRDAKFRAEVYRRCDTTQKHLAKRKKHA